MGAKFLDSTEDKFITRVAETKKYTQNLVGKLERKRWLGRSM